MHRASIRDLVEPFALLGAELTVERGLFVDDVDHPRSCLGVVEVACVNAPMPKANVYALERPSLLVRIHPERHRGASAQSRQEELIGGRPEVGPPSRLRLVSREHMPARLHPLDKATRPTVDDHETLGCILGNLFERFGQVATDPGSQAVGDVANIGTSCEQCANTAKATGSVAGRCSRPASVWPSLPVKSNLSLAVIEPPSRPNVQRSSNFAIAPSAARVAVRFSTRSSLLLLVRAV